jgi:hypothetical protein
MALKAPIRESSLPLSSLANLKGTAVKDSSVAEIEPAAWRKYGIGIDVHSRFAEVCVLLPDFGQGTVRY